jgi:hypothetical protein
VRQEARLQGPQGGAHHQPAAGEKVTSKKVKGFTIDWRKIQLDDPSGSWASSKCRCGCART